MAEFLFEIFCEEIPARMQKQAEADTKTVLTQLLTDAGINVENPQSFVGPRRMTYVASISESTKALSEERRGPRVGAPAQAMDGFLKSTGLPQDQLVERDGYYYAVMESPARQSKDLIIPILNTFLRNFSWPKSMRYPGANHPWIRPIQNVLVMIDGVVVDGHLEACGKTTNATTFGHRFIDDNCALQIKSFADYKEKLESHHIVLDHQERMSRIQKQLNDYAAAHNLSVVQDDGLLNEVAGLVEYPILLIGTIEDQFMHIPACVLTTSMRVHQKYFAFAKKDDALAPVFGVVANHIANDSSIMLKGFERVLRARLTDAAFFYDLDLKTPLLDHLPKLDNIVFQEKLGTLGNKIRRVQSVLTSEDAKKAASLSKCDLLTQMVGEFPELQGVMGEIYARAEGCSNDIARVIPEHYKPLGPSDQVPTTQLSIQVALADKIDTLVGFFGIGLKPSGSKDPFALRRTALGIIRIIIENRLDHNLVDLLKNAVAAYAQQNITVSADALNECTSFILDRLEVYLKGQDIDAGIVRGVLKTMDISHNLKLTQLHTRCTAVANLISMPVGKELKAAHKRSVGVIGQNDTNVTVDVSRLAESQEIALFKALSENEVGIEQQLAAQNYEGAITTLASLQPAINAFFDHVMVNVDDAVTKANRINLLTRFIATVNKIADFSCIEG